MDGCSNSALTTKGVGCAFTEKFASAMKERPFPFTEYVETFPGLIRREKDALAFDTAKWCDANREAAEAQCATGRGAVCYYAPAWDEGKAQFEACRRKVAVATYPGGEID